MSLCACCCLALENNLTSGIYLTYRNILFTQDKAQYLSIFWSKVVVLPQLPLVDYTVNLVMTLEIVWYIFGVATAPT